MKVFNIYKNEFGDYKAIKVGWSWTGFFFKWLWALYNKLWLVAILYFILICVFFSLIKPSDLESAKFIITIISSIIFGSCGNDWKANDLLNKGYTCKGFVTAFNQIDAIDIYISENE